MKEEYKHICLTTEGVEHWWDRCLMLELRKPNPSPQRIEMYLGYREDYIQRGIESRKRLIENQKKISE